MVDHKKATKQLSAEIQTPIPSSNGDEDLASQPETRGSGGTEYGATIYPGLDKPLPADFVSLIKRLENELKMPVWLLFQCGNDYNLDQLSPYIRTQFAKASGKLKPSQKIALVIDSPGGLAGPTYQIARMFQRVCGGFTALVPRYAKSAATLLALGADEIIMGGHAELGPLDAQLYSPERENTMSALDVVQALERLHAFGLEAADKTMFLLIPRTKKRIDTLLPLSLDFVSELMRPLLEQVDVLQYSEMSRALKVAEEYAERLLSLRYPESKAEEISRKLVENYPEHAFVIDCDEARQLGLPVNDGSPAVCEILDSIFHYLNELDQPITIIGQLEEVSHHGK